MVVQKRLWMVAIMEDEFTDKMPNWFKRQMDYYGRMPCQDHTKFLKDGSVILEPYEVRKKEVELLISFCNDKKLDFIISGTSFHRPGKTLRIMIYPKRRF